MSQLIASLFVWTLLAAPLSHARFSSGTVLVQNELPELYESFRRTLSPAKLDAFFSEWTIDEVEAFRSKTHGIAGAIGAHEETAWSPEEVETLRKNHQSRFLGLLGEIWGVSQLRKELPRSIQFAHEYDVHRAIPEGKRIDGIAYEVKDGRLIIHHLIEAKISSQQNLKEIRGQVQGLLDTLKEKGIVLKGEEFSPKQIYSANLPDTPLSLMPASLPDRFSWTVIQPAEIREGAFSTRELPVSLPEIRFATTCYFADLANLKGSKRQAYLAPHESLEALRLRIIALAEILGTKGDTFHQNFSEGVRPSDYRSLTQNIHEPVRRIARAIREGHLRIPDWLRKNHFTPDGFLNATDSEAKAWRLKAIEKRQEEVLETDRLRRRIIALAEILGIRGDNFYQNFSKGVGPTDYGSLAHGNNAPTRRVARAIREGHLRLPDWLKDLGFEPVQFLDADESTAQRMMEKPRVWAPTDKKIIDKYRKRIIALAEILGTKGTTFHRNFSQGVGPTDYGSLTQNQDEPVRRIVRAIREGNLKLPDWLKDLEFDPVQLLDANEATVHRMMEKPRAWAITDTKTLDKYRKRIIALAEILGTKGGTFHRNFSKGVGPNDYSALTQNIDEPVRRIARAIGEGHLKLPDWLNKSHFTPEGFLSATDSEVEAWQLKAIKKRQDEFSGTDRLRRRIIALAEILRTKSSTFHQNFSGGVGPNDYNQLTQNGNEPVGRVARAIREGNLKLPDWLKDLEFDPVQFLDADESTAQRMMEKPRSWTPTDKKTLDRYRKRIIALAEILGTKGGTFHRNFSKGVGPKDYSLADSLDEPVQRIARAIREGHLKLPEWLKDLGFEPVQFLDADESTAQRMMEKPRAWAITNTETLNIYRKRIIALAEILGTKGRTFHQNFSQGVGPSDYTNLTQNTAEPVRRIARAIREGHFGQGARLLSDGMDEQGFDAAEFLDASDEKAARMLSPVLSRLLTDEMLNPARRLALQNLRQSFLSTPACFESIAGLK